MTTALDKETNKLADEIVNEFIRLKVSMNDDPCSGLMVCGPNVLVDKPVVDIYDDHGSSFYDAQKVLAHLKELQLGDVSLDSEDVNNIWQHLAEFEV